MDALSELFRKFGSDKGGEHLKAGDTCHRYSQVYHHMFCDRREQISNVLEIGVAHGHSLRAWREYFPNALIVGIDNNAACLFDQDRICCFAADQNSSSDLDRVMAELGDRKFDLMVDDGSHERSHQIFSAQYFLPYLARDGYYVVEDIEPDCKPELVGNPVVLTRPQFNWRPVPTGHGIGRAHCQCGCDEGEQLVVFRRRL